MKSTVWSLLLSSFIRGATTWSVSPETSSWAEASPAYAPSQNPVVTREARQTKYNWDLTWAHVNPDGAQVRSVIAINGKWPAPPIVIDKGDTIIVTVNNKLGNQSTSIHWHGIYQDRSPHQDGPPAVTQCPIPPGASYTYQFKIDQPGSYWYHAHSSGQVPDGLRGPIVVNDPNDPYRGQYDGEFLMTITDWYHDQASGRPGLIEYYLDANQNGDGAEPIPYSGLMNEQRAIGNNIPSGLQYLVKPNKRYKIRIINQSTWSQASVYFDGHPVEIIESDGIYTKPQKVSSVYIVTAQRYSVLLSTKKISDKNFGILMALDVQKYDDPTVCTLPNLTAALVYDKAKPLAGTPTVTQWSTFDDFDLVPLDGQRAETGKPDLSIGLTLDFATIDGQNRAVFNDITYLMQKVPTLYTAISSGQAAWNPDIYGHNAHVFVANDSQLIEIKIANMDGGSHPIHIHGHAPQMIYRTPATLKHGQRPRKHRRRKSHGSIQHRPHNPNPQPLPDTNRIPARRDTWFLAPNSLDPATSPNQTDSTTIVRFRTHNPGVWLIHCHMDWHIDAGLTATLVVAPARIQRDNAEIPAQMKGICKAQGIPTVGNCAGNTKNVLDTSKCVSKVGPPVPAGDVYGESA